MSAYPGDDAARAWAGASPYRFLTYPIGGAELSSVAETWRGRAAFLRSLGWGLAVLYAPRVAEQGPARPLSNGLTRSLGAADGYDAVSRWRWERMPMGATCFLDMTSLRGNDWSRGRPPGWLDYYAGWIGAALDGGTVYPGTCCAASDAPVLAEAMLAVYRERRRVPKRVPFWTISPRPVSLVSDRVGAPPQSRDDQASWRTEIWQSEAGATCQTYAGASLVISPCWATTPDPSFDLALVDPVIDAASLTAVLRPGAAPSMTTTLPSPVVADVRALMDACLGLLAKAQLGGATPFPRGISEVEIQLTERDGAADVRIRVSANSPTDALTD